MERRRSISTWYADIVCQEQTKRETLPPPTLRTSELPAPEDRDDRKDPPDPFPATSPAPNLLLLRQAETSPSIRQALMVGTGLPRVSPR